MIRASAIYQGEKAARPTNNERRERRDGKKNREYRPGLFHSRYLKLGQPNKYRHEGIEVTESEKLLER